MRPTESALGAPASILYHALMPCRTRIRKLAMWTSTVFTLLVFMTWIASGWFGVLRISIVPGTFDDKRYCGISRGQFEHIRLSLSGKRRRASRAGTSEWS